MNKSSQPLHIERIRFGLRFKIILWLTLLNIFGTAVFAWNHYRTERASTIDGVEQRLRTAARALPDMLPPGYLDRAISASGIGAAEYRKVIDQLSAYCDETELIYLYSYVLVDGKFHTTSTNGTPDELATGTFAEYWEEYPEPRLHKAWNSNSAMFGETTEEDVWAPVYFLFSPGVTASGTRYIVGADIAITWLYARLDESLWRSIWIGFGSFTIVFLFSFYLGAVVSRKLTRLAEYTRELAESDFAPVKDDALRRDVERIPLGQRDEISQLASSFIAMERRLATYLSELTEATATKERLRNELRIAGDIQESMLPSSFAASRQKRPYARIDLHATIKPAKEAGGDLYDFIFVDDEHLLFAVGDVSDKGMPSALFMTVAITLLRGFATAELKHAPHLILARTNDRLEEQNPMCQFVTVFVGIINVRTGAVKYANGGHNPPYVCRPGALPCKLPHADGMALGVLSGVDYECLELQLEPGDMLYLYSDGVTDALNVAEELYGEARLESVLAAISTRDVGAADWVETSMASVDAYAEGHAQADDITILALRFLSENP